MGMIMNRYAMLNELKQDLKEERAHSHLAKDLCLTGVLVHDPADVKLKELLKQRSSMLAEMTGEHFLFITFVAPTEKWKRSDYGRQTDYFDFKALMFDSNQDTEDETVTTALLRDYYGLPREGSYMMLTNDLNTSFGSFLCVSANSIEKQLRSLASYCEEEASGVPHSPCDYSALVDRLNGGYFPWRSFDSFIETLCNLTSWTTGLEQFYPGNEQRNVAEKEISRLRQELKQYNAEDYEERLFNFCEGLARRQDRLTNSLREEGLTNILREEHYLYCRLNQQEEPKPTPGRFGNHLMYRRKPSYDRFLDITSKKLYRTYKILQYCFANYEEDLDYSGLTIYLGKIVENEMNLSYGQMLRYVMGIDMPEYFNKYCRKRGRVVVKAGKVNLDLNRHKKGKSHTALQSIPIGQLLCLYDELAASQNECDRFCYMDDNLHDFLSNFATKCRNYASHVDDHSEDTYYRTKKRFEEFMRCYLVTMYEIRSTLSGERALHL